MNIFLNNKLIMIILENSLNSIIKTFLKPKFLIWFKIAWIIQLKFVLF